MSRTFKKFGPIARRKFLGQKLGILKKPQEAPEADPQPDVDSLEADRMARIQAQRRAAARSGRRSTILSRSNNLGT